MPQQYSVLMIDDDPEICTLTQRFFSQKTTTLDFHCLTDARQVIQTVQETRADLIILDHGMPHLNGLDVLHTLDEKLHDQAPPVIYQTAYPDYRDQALAAGAQDYFLKSETTLATLYARVQVHLAAAQQYAPPLDTLQRLIARGRDELQAWHTTSAHLTKESEPQAWCFGVEPGKQPSARKLYPLHDHSANLGPQPFNVDQLDWLYSFNGQPFFIEDTAALASFASWANIEETPACLFAWPVDLHRQRFGVWVFYALKQAADYPIKPQGLALFAKWRQTLGKTVDEIYRLRTQRDNLARSLQRTAAQIDRVNLTLAQALDDLPAPTPALQQTQAELGRLSTDARDYAQVFNPAVTFSPQLLLENKTIVAKHNLIQVMETCCASIQPWANMHQVDIRTTLEDTLQQAYLDAAAAKALPIILRQLLRNAVEAYLYDFKLKPDRRYSVVLNLQQDTHCGGFSDAAYAAYQQHLCDSWSSKAADRGWGLQSTTQLVTQLAGQIQIERQPGSDWRTQVTIQLPQHILLQEKHDG